MRKNTEFAKGYQLHPFFGQLFGKLTLLILLQGCFSGEFHSSKASPLYFTILRRKIMGYNAPCNDVINSSM